ncbi:helix-turn-helix domain-containing protein [Clostridium cuniculi]|uniref:helix-turn-helix domain-containing protein n=1 Tax=Clostridium cuniculi TaxID=2548455 RepID=UPI0010569AB2|nr:helix-turn-helix transcriptional regulator [Clostridium cuniculi]
MKITPIKKRRIFLGMTDTDDVVEQLEISKSTFYKLEQGHAKPSALLIARMARVYQCTTDEIYEDFDIRG